MLQHCQYKFSLALSQNYLPWRVFDAQAEAKRRELVAAQTELNQALAHLREMSEQARETESVPQREPEPPKPTLLNYKAVCDDLMQRLEQEFISQPEVQGMFEKHQARKQEQTQSLAQQEPQTPPRATLREEQRPGLSLSR